MSRIAVEMSHQDQAKDLIAERANSTIDLNTLADLFHGGKERWEKKKWLLSFLKEKEFDKRNVYFLGRVEVSDYNEISLLSLFEYISSINCGHDST